jgi:hypothetical protein
MSSGQLEPDRPDGRPAETTGRVRYAGEAGAMAGWPA